MDNFKIGDKIQSKLTGRILYVNDICQYEGLYDDKHVLVCSTRNNVSNTEGVYTACIVKFEDAELFKEKKQ